MNTKKMLTALTAAGLLLGLGACSEESSDPDPTHMSGPKEVLERGAEGGSDQGTDLSDSGSGEIAPNLPVYVGGSIPSSEVRVLETQSPDYESARGSVTPGGSAEDPHGTCSIGFIAKDSSPSTFTVTAGHCADYSGEVVSSDGNTLGEYAPGVFDVNGAGDYGTLRVSDTRYSEMEHRIGGKYPVVGVVDPTELTTDVEVCKWGAATGESCGLMIGTDRNFGNAALQSSPGDSGSPVYIRKEDGTAEIVGVTGGTNDRDMGDTTYFTYATVALEELGLTAVTS